jgi:hypothetical protein
MSIWKDKLLITDEELRELREEKIRQNAVEAEMIADKELMGDQEDE